MAQQLGIVGRLKLVFTMSRKRAQEGHLSFLRQLLEMSLLKMSHGIGPEYYHTAGFWRRNIPWGDKTMHLSSRDYNKMVDRFNPREYRKLSQNKVAEKSIINFFHIPSTKYLGCLNPQFGFTYNGAELRDEADFNRFIASLDSSRLCMKPVEGWGGQDVFAVELITDGDAKVMRDLRSGKTYAVSEFYEKLFSNSSASVWVIEEYFIQHPTIAALNPSSLNTLRIWVFKLPGGVSRSVGGYLRIGRAGSVVDNQSSGGIVAAVDQATGMLGSAIDGLPTHEVYPHHPDTDAAIEGVTVPMWEAANDLAAKALDVFPNLDFAGLDIALGKNGPVVVELNVSPDKEGLAFMKLPRESIFWK